ncbi:MAG: biotin/lipoyl-binding protein, partial [Anaerolineales bacterium]|nr:biotin/lipoyl-binding protein [Anaerolineales bacterium]
MRKGTKNKRLVWIGGALLVVAIIAVFVATRDSSQAQTTTPAGEVVTAFIGDLSAEATASGTVEARRQASLAVQTPGLVTAVPIHVGDTVQAGDLLVQLDNSELALSVATAAQSLRLQEANLDNLRQPANEADIAAAEAAVASAQANLDDVLAGPTETEIAISEASIRASQASLYSSSAELARAQSSIADSQVAAAQAALLAAQTTLDHAREVNEEGPNAENHQALLEAEQAVADAQAQLDDLLAGPDVNAERSSVAAASARVDGSEADLNVLLAGPSETDITSAQLQLAQAEASLASL